MDRTESMKLRTNTLYLPLINKTPADSPTILTAMPEIEIVTRHSGQQVPFLHVTKNCTELC